jgi:hypothetical protein
MTDDEKVEYMVALDDPSVSSGSSSSRSSSSSSMKFYRTVEPIDLNHTLAQVFDMLTGSVFSHLFGTAASANARGLELVIIFGMNARSGEKVRNVERNCAVLKWGKAVKDFSEIFNVTFKIYERNMNSSNSSAEPNRSLSVTPKFSIFLNPKEKADSARNDEVNDRGLFLPLERSQWELLHGLKFSPQPYTTKRWDTIIRLLFNRNDIKYTEKVVNNSKHHIYDFISDFSVLLGKLNYRFNRILVLKIDLKTCPILGPFFEEPSRPYSNTDTENKISESGWFYCHDLLKYTSMLFLLCMDLEIFQV